MTAAHISACPAYHEKNYSEETAKYIDEEVRKLIDEAHAKAVEISRSHRDKVQLMTEMLMEFETLDREDVLEIMDGTWDSEKKKKRLKITEELQRKLPPPPPAPARGLKKPSQDNPSLQGI